MPWEPWTETTFRTAPRRLCRRWTENGQTLMIQWDSENGVLTDAFNNQISRSEAERITSPRVSYNTTNTAVSPGAGFNSRLNYPATNVGPADSLFPRSQEFSSRVSLPSQTADRYTRSNPEFRGSRTSERSTPDIRSPVMQDYPTVPQRTFNTSSDLRQLDNLRSGERDEINRNLPTSARPSGERANSTTQTVSLSGMPRRDPPQIQASARQYSIDRYNPPQDLGEFETDDVEKFAIKMKDDGTGETSKNNNLENPYFRSSAKILDPNYKRRPGQWFVPGKTFAVLWHENAGEGSGSVKNKKPRDRDGSSSGEQIYSHIRRLVVIKNRRGYCLCVSINTYGGQGCLKRGLTREEANAHAVIYDSRIGRPPSVEDQRLLTKDAIAVDMVGVETFNRWSRIHFGKIYSVESNLKVKEIGKVTVESLPMLLKYAKEEWAVITD